MSEASEPRRRNAAATREALLEATRTLLAEHGAHVTTRDIAGAAGVNQSLVNRYFGSKENLFVEAVRGSISTTVDLVATAPLDELPDGILRQVLEVSDSGGGMTGLLVGVVDSETVNDVIRDAIEKTFTETLGNRLDGPDAALKAELINALVVGISLMRHRIASREIADADVEDISRYVRLMVAPLLGRAH
ncbi:MULTISPECIES: TetR/AcrR family transcriptional regulator [unclassified Gordonia (in: high G+C Gram-positive bacteria)]|uniref:TetR/AcrR family transcriptional regulator n=1 Tax=unclassified Gordonia (in: high G+C Gram-positive bacteria) TaxID=2657482 RepID=UPI001F11270A|nr:TetR/AcrR family transcriptional regulator [Gordonia sp. ABSL49_1]MCH5641186.1 TetR family transcriptional regulator [Gordonia sp. ABSL49_1]